MTYPLLQALSRIIDVDPAIYTMFVDKDHIGVYLRSSRAKLEFHGGTYQLTLSHDHTRIACCCSLKKPINMWLDINDPDFATKLSEHFNEFTDIVEQRLALIELTNV